MFKKSDMRFEEMVFDPARRRAAIADLSWRRTVMFWCAFVAGIGAFGASWSGELRPGGVLSAAVIIIIFLKWESDLRLLRVIDRLQKDSDDKPVA